MSANVLVILGTIVVPSVVICFVSLVTFVNLYLSIRRRFPAKVNCWFCNTDTRVPYDQLNAFDCPTCRQYNGFTADGDYNREIPEQYQLRLNNYCYHRPANITDDDKWGNSARSIAATSSSATPRNGLCFGCNRNQELKIHQLASFVPEDEDNYDAEVEEYRKQLEQAYKLCGRCERILKRTLNDVKRNILGSKLAQIGSKSLKVLDMHMIASTKQLAHLKRQRWAKVCVYAITGLLVMKLSQDLSETGWTVADLMRHCPPPLLSSIMVVVSYVLALKQLIWQQVETVLSEPAVQHTTERMELLGSELLQRYAPQLMQCSAPLFENFAQKVPTSERSSPFLLNGAVIALGALLASLGSQRTAIKQMLIVALCAVDCILKYMQYQDSGYHTTLLLTLAAFALAVSCIGQRIIRSDVACGGDMNSSFHKIYSQQCSEADYSDVDTTTDPSPSASFQQNFSPRMRAPHNIRPSDESLIEPKHRAMQNDAEDNLSRKSLDTTQSGSPSSLSMSPTNSFFMNSYAGNNFKMSGSLFNVAETTERGLDQTQAVFGSVGGPPAPGSLLKTPSFSVDDFQTTTKLHPGQAWNQRKCVTPSITSPRANQFRYSMGTIGQEAHALREDDPLIEDDIDRLSISGRVSMHGSFRAGPGTASSRVSLTNGNPFAQVKPSRGELEFDEISTATLRQRRIVRSRAEAPTTARESLWSGLLTTGAGTIAGGQQAHMSRTSSQSSGFESQVGTTQRNTPTEGDVLSVYTAPEIQAQLVGTEVSKAPPSPVPSSASVFHNQRQGTPYQVRSLFGEQNLFNNALQPKPSSDEGPSGLFFPKYNHFSTGGATASTASTMNRHIFPPQQSQTPSSYHHHPLQQNHSHLPGIGGGSTLSLHAYPMATSTTFGAAGFLQDRAPSVAETSFYTSNQPSETGSRASLLNLSKLSHGGITNATLPTA